LQQGLVKTGGRLGGRHCPLFMMLVRLSAIRWQKVGRTRRRLEYTVRG
jgi:hypothetical protein